VGTCKAFGSGSGFVARDQFGDLEVVAFSGSCPADLSHPVMRDQSLVETPTLAIPSEPLSQTRDIAQGVLMLVAKAQRQRIVTDCWRPDFLRLFAVLAEGDNFRLHRFTFEIHMSIPLAPTMFAACVINSCCLLPAFIAPTHGAASCS